MEDIKESKNVVTSYRLAQDTKDKLQQQLKDLGMTQEQYFNKVVGLMELENVKQNSFLSKDTTIIQANLDAILNSFISIADGSNNLICNKDIELEELNNTYKDMLSDKEISITNQKDELQEVYSNLLVVQEDSKKSSDELLSIRIDHNNQVEQLLGNIKDKTLIVEEYKNKNDMLLSDLQEYKQYKVELEEYKKLLADAQARNIDKDNIIRDNDYTVNQLNKSMEKASQDNHKELETLKKENQLNIRLEVAEVKEELNNKFSQEQFKHSKEIEEYQSKYRELLEELEKKRITPKATPKKTI
ncbi:hypothetical protein [Clostridium lacusfryxellense]|uniref:hypothetical protein n=1 Tax=Clostridium lacusfryxellense TaxID=205328 RepID=UPI001C0DFF2D|nr:hypothetical protein [Clostridium lacusfryxellense]MBU3111631.1 hypothetical protein [Clostridium lacusfryxellense]